MHCTCVRQTELPNTTALAADLLYHPDKTAPFYRHPLRDLESYRAAAAKSNSPENSARRCRRPAEAESAIARRLNCWRNRAPWWWRPGSRRACFQDPLIPFSRPLHAVRLAEWLTGQRASRRTGVLAGHRRPRFRGSQPCVGLRCRAPAGQAGDAPLASAQPVGTVALVSPPVNELRAALHGLPFGEEVADLGRGDPTAAAIPWARPFRELLRRLLGRFDMPHLDPMLPEFRELAAPALRTAVESSRAHGRG